MEMSKVTSTALEKITKDVGEIRGMEEMFKSEAQQVKIEEKVSSYTIYFV
jgi:hypothetical protein